VLTPSNLRCTQDFAVDLSWGYKSSQCATIFKGNGTNKAQIAIITAQYPEPSVRLRFPDERPHSLPLTCGQFVPCSDDKRLVTASVDRRVVLWNIAERKTRTLQLHDSHSSAVMSLCPALDGRCVYTGGADKRIITYDLEKQTAMQLFKMHERVISLQLVDAVPQCILATVQGKSDQIYLLDLRTQLSAVTMSWRFEEERKASSYCIKASWHSQGRLVSCGSLTNCVNIWDIRYVDMRRNPYPTQSLVAHDPMTRVYRFDFHPTDPGCAVSIGADHKVGYHCFTVATAPLNV